ncbi:RNA methyltransferase [Wenzhouxiangella limi]|uniref:RNA methyltransferase n=1 Tax=Wenzhouxiangella limi TaxID=2707351 RepID=UPI0019441C41|nr:RNA methyltransferase [Wenzhouxiangella limi]
MDESLLKRIRVVLVGTTHPGNIGSTARAMKVMGLSRLVLVEPRTFPSGEATALASNADDVLAAATVVNTFTDAIAGCALVLGCSGRPRALPMPTLDARAAAARALAEAGRHEVAVVFGREKTGLHDVEIRACHYLVSIPTSATYDSLNLAQAVQVICYEIRQAMLGDLPGEVAPADWTPEPPERLELFFQRLEQALLEIQFLNPAQPKRLMQRLRRLYLRARPDENELNILNGIVSATLETARGERKPKG